MNYKKIVSSLLILFSLIEINASKPTILIDSTRSNKKKIATSISLTTAAVSSQVVLYSFWYKPYNSGKFHFINDWNEWRNMDKLGHAYSAYHLSSSTYDLLRWSGYSSHKSLIFASSSTLLYQGCIEIMDGYSDGWGFSASDILFNLLGSGIFILQNKFDKSVVAPKFSYFPSAYAKLRPEALGNSNVSRILKDYNAQTYWLGIRPNALIPSFKAKWFLFSIGFSINEHLVGDQFSTTHHGESYNSYSQLLFSLDIDARSIPIRNKFVKKLLVPLNYIKIPFPTLAFEKGKVRFYPLYF